MRYVVAVVLVIVAGVVFVNHSIEHAGHMKVFIDLVMAIALFMWWVIAGSRRSGMRAYIDAPRTPGPTGNIPVRTGYMVSAKSDTTVLPLDSGKRPPARISTTKSAPAKVAEEVPHPVDVDSPPLEV